MRVLGIETEMKRLSDFSKPTIYVYFAEAENFNLDPGTAISLQFSLKSKKKPTIFICGLSYHNVMVFTAASQWFCDSNLILINPKAKSFIFDQNLLVLINR